MKHFTHIVAILLAVFAVSCANDDFQLPSTETPEVEEGLKRVSLCFDIDNFSVATDPGSRDITLAATQETATKNNLVNCLHIHSTGTGFRIFESSNYMYHVKSIAGSIRCVRETR